MPRTQDPLEVVARLRRVRELDSRQGLDQARRERTAAAELRDSLEARLAAPLPADLDSVDFVTARRTLTALGEDTESARRGHDSASAIADAAAAHWQHDRVRLEAIESLLTRRAEARAEERRARERVDLDDVALSGWLLRHGGREAVR